MTLAATRPRHDLQWPEEYEPLLALVHERWKVEGEIYLKQQLGGGKSGAQVFMVDITCDGFSGQAILKLDVAADPEARGKTEAALNREALEAAPDYGTRHLPTILQTEHLDGRIAILSTIVGRGLEYSVPWAECGYDGELESLQRLSRDLLEDWNSDYRLAGGMQMPQDLLAGWLGRRLDPERGRIFSFLEESCRFPSAEPSLSFEGLWYPNPLAFAREVIEVPARLRLRSVQGRQHGDLHGYNVLVKEQDQADLDYYLIDLAYYKDEQFLFYDHAYFEVAFLIAHREFASLRQWDAILDHLSIYHHKSHSPGLWHDDVGTMEFVRVLRREPLAWIERHESHRLSFMESQCLLARVAAGLNFASKRISTEARQRAFIYAAASLKDYLKLNHLDWPKHGPAFGVEATDRPTVRTESTGQASGTPHLPAPEKDRLIDHLVTQLPTPQKPVVAIMPFEPLDENTARDRVADGITQEVVTDLSQIDWLAVISPRSTLSATGKGLSPDDVARQFGAHYLVEGSVRRRNDTVRVTAHLVDVSTGLQLWADRFERKADDVLAIQEDIAEAVVGNIDWELKFDVRERARLKRGEVSVWDRVQRAMWHLMKFSEDDTAEATEILDSTLHLAPGYSYAHAGMALVELRRRIFSDVDYDEAAKNALYHARRAVELDDQNSFARSMLARCYLLFGRKDQANLEAKISARLNPSSSNAHLVLAQTLIARGRASEALVEVNRAIKLSQSTPYLKVKLLTKGFILYALDNFESAEVCARRALQGRAVGPYGNYVLGAILARQNRMEEAHEAIETGLGIRPDMTASKLSQTFGYLDRQYMDRFLDDLRRAGLPE